MEHYSRVRQSGRALERIPNITCRRAAQQCRARLPSTDKAPDIWWQKISKSLVSGAGLLAFDVHFLSFRFTTPDDITSVHWLEYIVLKGVAHLAEQTTIGLIC